MSTALEYAVDEWGRVSTDAIYREITLAQWDSLRPVSKRSYTRYGPALEAVAQGKIVAVPALDAKRAWNIRRSIRLTAKRRGQLVEIRRVFDPQVQGGELVLVRAQQS